MLVQGISQKISNSNYIPWISSITLASFKEFKSHYGDGYHSGQSRTGHSSSQSSVTRSFSFLPNNTIILKLSSWEAPKNSTSYHLHQATTTSHCDGLPKIRNLNHLMRKYQTKTEG
jgi:hypothetical protein